MSQLRNKNQIKKRKKIIKLILVIIFFIFLAYFTHYTFLAKAVNFLGQPFWKTEKYLEINIKKNESLLKSKKDLWRENEELKKENEENKISMLDYQVLKDENEKLKNILDRLPDDHDFILGNILAKPNRSPYDTIIIDLGLKQGMNKGNKILANGYIPIGEIDEVYENTSRVILYSSPEKKTEGILSNSNISVELTGRGGGNFEMLIPKDVDFEIGTLVLIPGSSIEIIAYISEILSVPTDPIEKVLLASPVNVQDLKWVEVKIN